MMTEGLSAVAVVVVVARWDDGSIPTIDIPPTIYKYIYMKGKERETVAEETLIGEGKSSERKR